MNTIAVFDFDGTITCKDTMTDFIRFVKGSFAFCVGLCWISPYLAAYLLKILSRQRAKEILLSHFFKDTPEVELYEWGKKYAQTRLPQFIRPKASEIIAKHKAYHHRLYLVTASLTFWTKAWAEENGFILIASEPEIKDGRFTGKLNGKNCYGQQKLNRLLALLTPEENYRSFVYGDSQGDTELLRWADVPFYRGLE